MKNLMFLVTILIGFGAKAQREINWVDIEKAQIMVRKDTRPIMMFIYADWCDHCNLIKSTTFKNKDIINYINANFIPVKFNAETREAIVFNGRRFVNKQTGEKPKHQLALYLAVKNKTIGFPTIVFLDKNYNKLMVPTRGYKTIARMELFLRYIAERHYRTETFEKYAPEFVSQFERSQATYDAPNDEECVD
jgi:thioredoxin-related protein